MKTPIRILMVLFSLVLFTVESTAGTIEKGPLTALTLGFPGDVVENPSVAYNSKRQEFFVVYAYKNSLLNTTFSIHGARLSATGDYIANYNNISSDATGENTAPTIAYDAKLDRYLVVWNNIPSDSSPQYANIRARYIPFDGPDSTIASFPMTLATNSAPALYLYPRIAFNEDKREFLVLFNHFHNLGAGGPGYRILGLRQNADSNSGVNWGTFLFDVTIQSHSESRSYPDIIYNSLHKEYFVVYDDIGQSANYNLGNIFGVRIDGNTLKKNGNEFVIAGWPGGERTPHVALNQKDDQYFISWNAVVDSETRVYGRFVSGTGIVGSVSRIDDIPASFGNDIVYNKNAHGYAISWIAENKSSSSKYIAIRFMNAEGQLEKGTLLSLVGHYSSAPPIATGGSKWFIGYAGHLALSDSQGFGHVLSNNNFPWNLFLQNIIQKEK